MKAFYKLGIAWLCSSFPCFSQEMIPSDSTSSFIEIQTYASSQKRLPFWMYTNQFGITPTQGPAAALHLSVIHYEKAGFNPKNWKIGGGIEAVTNYSENTKILLPQLFASLKRKNWELYAGRKKQWVGIADSTIGTGSYAWSGNTLPIPKIQLGTTQFIPIPFTFRLISFNAFYSEGMFERNRQITSKLKLHQKALYIKLGNEKTWFQIYAGFNHQVQWGGRSPYQTIEGQMPNSLKSYFYVITGKPHPKINGLTHFDFSNRIGNHLGSIDLAIETKIKNTSLLIYRQNIYEDGSLYYLNNISDGLNGIRIKKKSNPNAVFQINEAVLEFLCTKSQGGPIANLNPQIRGKDDYFNNAQVRDGWSYQGRTIGTPFISSASDTRERWPNHSDFFTNNNRISVWHLGLKGTFLDRINWSGKFSYSENYGTYDVPFDGTPRQFSAALSVQVYLYFLGGTTLRGVLATDIGKLYANTNGISLGIRKEGFLNIKEKRLGYFRY
ncbi:hypothetical protein DYBT9275_05961 [Dyadobacter sp. CECT 9275]|uniref:Capsule assembly protein Wzi n=1 Tax=Dyadobacter helix TaxID=2822344 RepID=A0A916N8T4_9BACT|nr:capsule assembly Wzi family protein [Dyadobacter sp. CECT 9275]CAG5018234.1 hypothetical protein DYBT9275_05961 [Dyadobacter sp. CECT 9275]